MKIKEYNIIKSKKQEFSIKKKLILYKFEQYLKNRIKINIKMNDN